MSSQTDRIDAHVHVWTPDVDQYPLGEGYAPGDMKPASFAPEQLMEHAHPCGVERIVLIQMSFYGANDYMLDVIESRPETFIGVAVIDDQADRPQDEMRELQSRGVSGFRLVTPKCDVESWFASPGIQAMWKCGAEAGQSMCLLCAPGDLPAIERMCRQFPDTSVVIDHLARIGGDGEVRNSEVDQLCRLGEQRQVHVKVSAFYALGKKQPPYDDLAPMIRRLRDAYGAERLMWASDCPFQVYPGHTYKDSVNLVAERLDFLSTEEKEWILGKTAERVFFSI